MIRWLLLVLCGSLLFGCAPPRAGVGQRILFPPAPEQPRFEYLGFVRSDQDVTRTNPSARWFEEAIFGRERPEGLFDDPYAVDADGTGRVFIVEPGRRQVLILDFVKEEIREFLDAQGDSFAFSMPFGLAADDEGVIYLSDLTGPRVCIFDRSEKLVNEFKLDRDVRPVGLAVDRVRDRIYIVDVSGHRLLLYSRAGEKLAEWGGRGSRAGEFNFPVDVDIDRSGNVYVLDAMNARVQKFDPDGNALKSFGERGTAIGSFQVPKALAVGPSGLVYVTDALGHRFLVFDVEGNHLMTIGGKKAITGGTIIPGGFYMPRGIAADEQDTIWVVDSLNRTLHHFQYLNDNYLGSHPLDNAGSRGPVSGRPR